MTASSSKRPGDTPTRTKSKSRTAEKQQNKPEKSKGKGKEKDLSGAATSRTEGPSTVAHDAGIARPGSSSWDWRAITEPTSSTVPPIFTKDGSYFFSVIGSSIKIHSTATGQVVSTLTAEPASSTNTITCAILNPHNVFQLITGSLNGQIVIWDFLEGVILQTIDIEQPIRHICAHKKFDESIFVAAGKSGSKKKGAEDKFAVLQVSLRPSAETASSKVQKPSTMVPIGKTRSTVGLSFSPSGAWLVAAAGYKAYVASTNSLQAGFTKFVSNERLTCLAFHPDEEYFATGDEKGQIRLWYCLNGDLASASQAVGVGKKAQTTTLHWHAHAVSSLVFTANGAYLLSGGEEAVLVIWQLHTGKKEFVPRVGAPISTVSLSRTQDSSEEYLLGLADSTYLFINPTTLKPSRSYTRVKIDPSHSMATSAHAPLAYHTKTSTLILPSSHASSLQVYSPTTSKVQSELEVVPSSRVSKRDEEPLEPPAVENVAVSDNGDWMATVDHRADDGSFRAEIHLKLWWWDKKAGQWTLNTRIESPHALSPVLSVDFQPASSGQPLHLVTSSVDGSVKTWRIRTVKNKGGDYEDFWILRSTITFRNEKPQSIAFSPCGTLLAVVLKSHVALYDPSTNVQLDTLSLPECPDLQSAHFAGKGRYLVLAGARDLILWDVILQNVHWHHSTTQDITCLVVHPAGDTFAVFHKGHNSTRITIHRLGAPNPIKTHNLPFSIRSLLWNAGAQVQKGFYSLIAITQAWSVVEFGDHIRTSDGESAKAQGISAQGPSAQRPSLFQDIFGSLSAAAEPEEARAHVETWRGKEGAAVFDGPAYLLPPLRSLYSTLIDGFLRVRPESSSSDSKEVDEDVEMEDAASDDRPPATKVVGRSVDKEEIDTLVGLFKQSAISAPSPTKAPAVKANGVKVNGSGHHAPSPLSTPKQNGVQQKSKGQQPITPLNHPPISPTSSDSSDSPAPVNTGNTKKRKKVP